MSRLLHSTPTRVLAFTLALALAAAGTPYAMQARVGRAACGTELWTLKTLSDPQSNLVRLRPSATTIAAINALPMPEPTPTTRSTRYQRQVWRVHAQIVEYKLEEDEDIHLILFGSGSFLIAEMPAANCLAHSRDRLALVKARQIFESRCGSATHEWRQLGAVALISGVGFWDFPHGQSGHASNYAELHPVTSIRFVSGCGT